MKSIFGTAGNLSLVLGYMGNSLLKSFYLCFFAILLTACPGGKDPEPEIHTPADGIYMGVIGFNYNTQSTTSIDADGMLYLNSTGSTLLNNFITNLEQGNNTALFYAMNEGIDNLTKAELPSSVTKVSIVTFSDGLDNASSSKDVNYPTYDAYHNFIQNKIKSTKVKDVSLDSYVIGIKGNDVIDEVKFTQTLQSLASDEEKFSLVTDFSQLEQEFQKIANELTQIETNKKLICRMPALDDNIPVKWTLDIYSSTDYSSSTTYIEGTFRKTVVDGKFVFSLSNINYSGVTSSTTGEIVGYQNENGSVEFTFQNIELQNNVGANILFWRQSNNNWQIDSEAETGEIIETTVTENSLAVFLILDCSSSLGTDIYSIKSYAKGFISTLLNSGTNSNNSNTSPPPTYSTPSYLSGTYVYNTNDYFYFNSDMTFTRYVYGVAYPGEYFISGNTIYVTFYGGSSFSGSIYSSAINFGGYYYYK